MSISPDDPQFTACAIGESLSDEPADLEAALLQDPAWRSEAQAIQQTSLRLAAALRKEPAVSLTFPQRHAVLHPASASGVRGKSRPVWISPTLATAGIAAAVALGIYALPAMNDETPALGMEPGVPSVAIHTPGPSKAAVAPALPPTQLASGAPVTQVMPQAAPLESPAQLNASGTMAANPPMMEVIPAPLSPVAPPREDFAPPGEAAAPRPLPGESLASPAPPRH